MNPEYYLKNPMAHWRRVNELYVESVQNAPGLKQGWSDRRKEQRGKIVRYKISPMPFRLENDNVIYMPNDMLRHRRLGRIGPCTMACPQFINYDGDKDGIRIIPKTAVCPYAGVAGAPCRGNFVVQDGKFMTKIVINKRAGVEYKSRIISKNCNDFGR